MSIIPEQFYMVERIVFHHVFKKNLTFVVK